MMEAYLDNAATTMVFDSVKEIMIKTMSEDYGNPSSMHIMGVHAENYIKQAKKTIAAALKVQEKEILFTSGGTESNNMAIIGAAMANRRRGNRIVTTQMEHASVARPMKYLEEQGFEVTYLPVDSSGVISLDDLDSAVGSDTILVSVMYVNNEIGSIQPIEAIGERIKKKNPLTLFHVDAIQAFGKIPIYPKRFHIDFMSVSGHKIHGPKGTGFLYIGEKAKLKPLMYGGGQQNDMRSGTENVPGIAGLSRAVEEIAGNIEKHGEEMTKLKDYFIHLVEQIPGVTVNSGKGKTSAPHIISVSVEGVRSEVLLHALEERGIYVSAGSACASNKPEVSRTLKAIGIRKDLLDSTVRFSLSMYTTKEELCYAAENLRELSEKLRLYKRK